MNYLLILYVAIYGKAADVEAVRGHRGSASLRIEAFLTLRVLVAKVKLHRTECIVCNRTYNWASNPGVPDIVFAKILSELLKSESDIYLLRPWNHGYIEKQAMEYGVLS